MFNGHASSLGNAQSYSKQLSIRSSCSTSWGLGGIIPNMFLKGQASIKVESQVSPVCLGFESKGINS